MTTNNITAATTLQDPGRVCVSPDLFRRRRFIVSWKLQLGLLAYVLAYVGMALFVAFAALIIPAAAQLYNGHGSPESIKAAAALIFLDSRLGPASFVAVLGICLHWILTSHRIAGPLFRLRREMRSVAAGVIPPPIRLRRHDVLQADAAAFNEMLAGLRRRQSDASDAIRMLRRVRPLLIESEAAEGVRALIGQLDEVLARHTVGGAQPESGR